MCTSCCERGNSRTYNNATQCHSLQAGDQATAIAELGERGSGARRSRRWPAACFPWPWHRQVSGCEAQGPQVDRAHRQGLQVIRDAHMSRVLVMQYMLCANAAHV
jgi:hypothetical protein